MNAQPVVLRPGQTLLKDCKGCSRPLRECFAPVGQTPFYADLDGEPFEAYYHWHCVPGGVS